MTRTAPRRKPPEVRRRELLDAALDVIVEEGFDAVTVEAVARRAGVTRPMIYDQFGDLDGLLLALIDREEESALAPIMAIVGGMPAPDADPEAFLADSVAAFLEAVRANPRTWRLVLMPPRGTSADVYERIARSRRFSIDRVTELLDWGVPRRGGPSGLDHALLARLLVATAEDAARLLLTDPRRFGVERFIALIRAGLVAVPTGISAPPALPPWAQDVPAEPAPIADDAARGSARMPRTERREQLLDAALHLVAEDGFDSLSIDAIARRAGVNRAIVYRSFANLQLLLVALLRREDARIRRTLDDLLPSDPGGREAEQLLNEALTSLLAAAMRDPATWRAVLLRPESAPLILQRLVHRRRAALAKQLRPLVQWGLSGLDAPTEDIDVDLVARMFLTIGEECARLALDDPEFPPQRLLAGTWAFISMLPRGTGPAPTAG